MTSMITCYHLLLYSISYKYHNDVTGNNDYEMMTVDQKDNSSVVTNPDRSPNFITLTASILRACLHVKTRRLQTKLNQLQLSINS